MLNRRRRLSWAVPIVLQTVSMSAGLALADDEPQLITIQEVKVEETKAEPRTVEVRVDAKPNKQEGKNDVYVVERRLNADEKTLERKPAEKAEPKTAHWAHVRVVSPDGKTIELSSPEGLSPLAGRQAFEFKGDGPKSVFKGGTITIVGGPAGEFKAIESGDVQSLIGELTGRINESKVDLPKFIVGVSVSEAPPVVLAQIGKPDAVAVVVDAVVDDSPAAKAGVQKFDLILRAAGEAVKSPSELTKAVKTADGKAVELVIVRSGKELTLLVTPKSNEKAERKVEIEGGTVQFGPAMMMKHHDLMLGGLAKDQGQLVTEIQALRKDIEELKKMVEALKAK